jgi:hypothetical protein
MRRRRGICCWLLCGTLGLAAPSSARQADPLARLDLDPAGWDGIRLGMSLVQLERRLGTTLPLSPRGAQPVCSAFATQGDYDGYRLVLGFAAAKPGAKLESLWVQFSGAEAGASAAALGDALRRRAPTATYVPAAGAPPGSEATDAKPAFDLPGKSAARVRFTPRDGVLIALAGCGG